MVDLRDVPIIDTHAHPFPASTVQLTVAQLRAALAVSLRGAASPVNDTGLLSRVTCHELGRFLRAEGTLEALVSARNEAARESYSGYIERLFADAGIAALLVDHGYPSSPVLDFAPFAALLPVPVFQGYRIERFFPTGSFHGEPGNAPMKSFNDMLEQFEDRLDYAITGEGCTFFKSIVAYRTGLDIRPVGIVDARDAWQAHRVYGDSFEKVVRDYLFVVTARKSREHGVPFQVHTGHTSHVNVWPNVNPILLTPLLNSGLLEGTTIVLVHGGYPYCTEAGYLTSVYGDLYLDLSLMIPWASIGITARILQTLEAAPTAKVMYGSDGITTPELHWISAIVARRALGAALDQLRGAHFISANEGEEIAHDVLWRTASRIYRVPEPARHLG